MTKAFLSVLLVTIVLPKYSISEQVVQVGMFSQKELSGWEQESFQGETKYHLAEDCENHYLRANARSAASALYKKIKIDLNDTPYLNWSWRIEKPLKPIAESTKQGDDYAARIYAIVRHGMLPWNTNALNYVWSSQAQPASAWPNAYTNKAWMIPLRSNNGVYTWKQEKVNVKVDFLKYFGTEVRYIHAIAIMTDTDNTNGQAIAGYGDIFFSSH